MKHRISDHALVRFLARAGGLDVEALRSRLAMSLERAGHAADSLGASDYRILVDGLEYHVRNGVVVTVIDPRERFEVRP